MTPPPHPVSPIVDVLIPVYNGARWLRASVQSIQRQTVRALCIHVVDDGSTDETPLILDALAAADARIRLHRKANGGIVEALNHGLAHCSAPYVARHDADDIAHPERLHHQLAYLRNHHDCVAVGAVARHIDAHGDWLGTCTRLRPLESADAHWLPAREPYLMHPMMTARLDALRAVGGYRPVTHAEDSDLYWRLRERGRLHNLPHILGDYRLHAGSVSSASAHHGRVMAVSSQLAALSASRRQAGRTDIPFDTARAARLRQSATLAAMVQEAGADLDDGERAHLALAAAAKLLELADYQPWELQPTDVQDLRRLLVLRRGKVAGAANSRALSLLLTRAAVRLARAGRPRDVLALLPHVLLPAFALRLAWRACMSDGARERLHAWRHRVRRGALR